MKIKMISIRDLEKATRDTVLRFPLLTFFLLMGAANHLYMDIFEKESLKYYSRNIFMAIVLLVPILYALQFFFESNWINKKRKFLLEGLSVLFAGVYLYFLPNSQLLAYHFSQFWLYLSISVLLCFVCIKDCLKSDDLFWHFHISLFSRINITSLYTSVILGGTSAALGAIDTLFKTKLLEYQEIRIVILTLWIFMPLFFLAGVPKFNILENILKYKPQWIKNIAIYVLIPFTTGYLAILYAYLGKIVFQWKLPEGMVSYFVLSFAAFGITSLIIVFPFQKDENSRWTYWFGRFFYFLQFPLLILLGIAIYQRVMDYGITFRRFYVLALAVWLLFITLFMVFRKNRSLITIPITLLAIALISSFGPWSAFNVSFVNQKARLDSILEKNGLVAAGKLKKPDTEIQSKVKGEICSITKYLFDYGKLNVYSKISAHQDTLTPKAFAHQLGFEYKVRWGSEYEDGEWFNYSFKDSVYDISNSEYNFLIKMDIPYWDEQGDKKINQENVSVEYIKESNLFKFKNSVNDSLLITMNEVIAEFGKSAKKEQVSEIVRENENLKILCLFDNLSGRKNVEGIKISSMSVDFLVRVKE
jgi:hypothetical protein